MKRDFSQNSLQRLLDMVVAVENDKLNNFTDWMGDRWYSFQTWIGKLSIKNYIDNVNTYHKKVIDKNNTTQKKIREIFANVNTVDRNYKGKLAAVNQSLQSIDNYVAQLCVIVNPKRNSFSEDYIVSSLRNLQEFITPQTSFDKNGFADLRRHDMLDRFMATRMGNKADAVLYALTRGLTEGVESAVNKLFGQDDMTDKAFKGSIMAIVGQIDSFSLGISSEKKALSIMKTTNGLCKDYNDFCELLRKNDESLKNFLMMDDDSYKKVGKLIKYGKAGVDAVEVLFTDYCTTIAILTEMRDGLIAINGDADTIAYCNALIEDYSNKFGLIVDQAWDMATGASVGAAVDAGVISSAALAESVIVEHTASVTVASAAEGISTGGLFAIADSAQSIIWKVSGLSDRGDALAAIYASAHYSEDLISAYEFYAEKLKSNMYTDQDLLMCQSLFELARTAKIQELENMKTVSDRISHDEINEQIAALEVLEWNNGAVIYEVIPITEEP